MENQHSCNGECHSHENESTDKNKINILEKPEIDVLVYGDPRLNEAGEPVTKDNFELAEECHKKMKEYLDLRESYGIAAQQLGYKLRMYMLSVKPNYLLVINPIIIPIKPAKYIDKVYEACTSIPNNTYMTRRYGVIKLRYKDKFMKWQEKRFKNDAAYIIQHLQDHIDGILLSDLNSVVSVDVGKCLMI